MQKNCVKIAKKTEWKSQDTRQRARCNSYSIPFNLSFSKTNLSSVSESKKSSAPLHFDASGWKSALFNVVLYKIGKKLSPWKMKKSWKSPGILFSHSHTNPVLTLCFACCRWVVLSLNCFVSIHTTVMLTVCYINRRPGRGYHYSNTNACGECAASNKCRKTGKLSYYGSSPTQAAVSCESNTEADNLWVRS